MNAVLVEDYAEDMREGAEFPPVVVFTDDGGTESWVGDGFHRVEAAKRAGLDEIEAEVTIHPHPQRAALLHACGANAAHGWRRTNADKRHAVTTLLKDDEWSGWTDVAIARACNVSSAYVGKLRRELNVEKAEERKTEGGGTIKVGRRGRKATMPTQNPAPEGGPVPATEVHEGGTDAPGDESEDSADDDLTGDPAGPPRWLAASTPSLEKAEPGGYRVVIRSPTMGHGDAFVDLAEVRSWLQRMA